MRKAWIWGGFGALLVVGILSGYVPDLNLMNELRGARAEGLLSLPTRPRIVTTDDARLAYEAAAKKYADGWNLLGNDFKGQTKKPSPHVVKYLDAMVAASTRPECSALSNESSGAYYGRTDLSVVFTAAKGLVARATDEADLAAAARIARHLSLQDGIEGPGYRAVLAVDVLDRAAKLHLDENMRRRLATDFGPPLPARETLRRHVAQRVANYDKEKRDQGGSVSRTRQEAAFLSFWRGFLRTAPPGGAALVEAVRKDEERIERVERWLNLSDVVGASTAEWADWTRKMEEAERRLAAKR